MKFIHTADIHLGASPDRNMPWGVNRQKEIWDTFKRLIMEVKQERPEMFFISGDLFHRQPKINELKEIDYLFSTLSPTRVLLIAGNHDPITETSKYKDFKWSPNVFFLSSDKMEIYSFEDIGVDVYGLSYHDKMIKENLYDYVKPQNKDRINILMAHGGDESHIPMNQNLILLNGFEYVACGHIHIPFLHKNASFAYPGSLEPIDKNDKGVRGYIYGEITKEERFITLKPFARRYYLDIEVNVASKMSCNEVYDAIAKQIEEQGSDNIYHVYIRGFRDPDIEFNKVDISLLGNVIAVSDESEPDYDFEELYNNNKDNMIGIYISRFKDRSSLNEVEKKALYYGTKALLDANRD